MYIKTSIYLYAHYINLDFEDEEQGTERDLFFEMKFVLRYE